MLLAYVDESGDSGYPQNVCSPTVAFALGVLLIDDRDWLEMLDQLVDLRRSFKNRFGLRMHDEIKANYLIHGKGPFREHRIDKNDCDTIYRECVECVAASQRIRVFAIVINKNLVQRQDVDARHWAWTFAIQRLERFGRAKQTNVMLFPDEGHGQFIQKKLREMRRFHQVPSAFNTERLEREASNIVEDPNDRASDKSYFVQMADLAAYAAFRAVHQIIPFDGSMWDQFAKSRIAEVNRLRGGVAGIVAWP